MRAVTASTVVTCEQDMSHLTSIKSAEKLAFIDRNLRINEKQWLAVNGEETASHSDA